RTARPLRARGQTRKCKNRRTPQSKDLPPWPALRCLWQGRPAPVEGRPSMSPDKPSVTISCFQGDMNGFAGTGKDAIVAVDVIRATTTAVTAVALGRICFPVPSLEAAVRIEAKLERPLLVGELGGNMPHGFDLTNSPAALAKRTDVSRPMILLSSSGTK